MCLLDKPFGNAKFCSDLVKVMFPTLLMNFKQLLLLKLRTAVAVHTDLAKK